MAKSDLRINILGTSITISTDEEPEYLNTLLSKYQATVENIQRVSGLKDPLKVAILTGFLLCDDLQKAGNGKTVEKESGELEQLTIGMISRLDEMLKVSEAPGADLAQSRDDAEEIKKNPDETLPLTENPEKNKEILDNSIAPPRLDKAEFDVAAPDAFFKLQNTVKNFEWGSADWLPTLMGQKNLSRIPWAELWMGVHPAGPSRIILPGGDGPLLSELIDSDPKTLLGAETAESFGKLPFLFKVEAVAKPLSIQVHPNIDQAREGFARENREGIPLDAPNRNYRDSNHKPEILCALSPFAALCGFREPKKISTFIDILYSNSEGRLKDDLEGLFFALEQGAADQDTKGEASIELSPQAKANPLKSFLTALFALGAETYKALGLLLKNRQALLEKDFPEYKDEWNLCSYFSGLYPEDPGVIAPLYLNIMELALGEAIYLPAGVPHAYIHGMGIELMSNSDNVLRGGLTSKYVDVKEFLGIVDFSEYRPEILKVPMPVPAWFSYPAPAGEFTLSMMCGSGAALPYSEKAPSIVIVTKGSATVTESQSGAEITLNTGESVFIPAGDKAGMAFSGVFTAYAASARPGLFHDADTCRC